MMRVFVAILLSRQDEGGGVIESVAFMDGDTLGRFLLWQDRRCGAGDQFAIKFPPSRIPERTGTAIIISISFVPRDSRHVEGGRRRVSPVALVSTVG